MTTLVASDFPAFFRALHGQDPFPWQARLATQVLAKGWPATIAMPTASGKTACIDVAVFALAVEGAKLGRRQARRIFFVVDRRIVVDEAFARAQRIASALAGARDGILALVATRLRELAGADEPLAASIMRGGIYRDDRWARSPAQPTVVVSTVDQVGSRLIGRGYGLSPAAWPLHAGLVANDSLVILDEAHCAKPFLQTLRAIQRYRGAEWAERPLGGPFEAVAMSATPASLENAFAAEASDLKHPVLGRRISASKLARLVVAKKGEAGLVACLAEHASAFASEPRAVAVVVNRVATARAVFAALKERAAPTARKRLYADVVLLTGRVRPAERDELLRTYLPVLCSDPSRAAPSRSTIVVATQCIEVGADLDFDVMVSECCALDSLRQRFGRLDRLGRLGTSQGAIVVRPEQQAGSEDDPVYGGSLAATWEWLSSVAVDGRVNMGGAALDKLLDGAEGGRAGILARAAAPAKDAPILLPAHCDCWVQTWPAPHADPDPAVYLHGLEEGAPEVQVVWRADLAEGSEDTWRECVALCPPSSGEALSLPIWAASRWLAGVGAPELSDREGGAETEEPEQMRPRAFLRWHGPEAESTEVVRDGRLFAGDTVVVPASYGGCDVFGWASDSTCPVSDLGDSQQAARRRAVLRLHPGVLAGLVRAVSLSRLSGIPEGEDEAVREVLGELAREPAAPGWLQHVAGFLAADRRLTVQGHPSGRGFVVASRKLLPDCGAVAGDFTDEDATSSGGTREVPLEDHSRLVEGKARGFALAAGLQPALADDCALAGRLHDWGKADPRFQVWLHGGDRLAASRTKSPLAKSGGAPRTPRALALARERSGYPSGARHELLSVRLGEAAEAALGKAADRDLVLHLIASHHGRCRPFAPAVADPAPKRVRAPGHPEAEVSSATGLERIDSGVADRFWLLVRRYGWWGLAWLESIVRLADHRASEEEQQ